MNKFFRDISTTLANLCYIFWQSSVYFRGRFFMDEHYFDRIEAETMPLIVSSLFLLCYFLSSLFFLFLSFLVVSFYLMKWDCFATLHVAGNGTWTRMKNHVVVAWLLTSCRAFVVRRSFWFSVFRKMLVICFLHDAFYSCTSSTIYRGNIADVCRHIVTYNCNMSVKVFYLQDIHSSILIA